ncbi:hypothetical protein KP2612_004140 [Komagataella phaffii]
MVELSSSEISFCGGKILTLIPVTSAPKILTKEFKLNVISFVNVVSNLSFVDHSCSVGNDWSKAEIEETKHLWLYVNASPCEC